MDLAASLDAVLSEINKIPCDDLATLGPQASAHRRLGVSCLKAQRESIAAGAITPFQKYDPSKMCNSCAAYWHASRAMTLVMNIEKP